MSYYSTPGEKYRKYVSLLKHDPTNDLYSRKMLKYKKMLKKSEGDKSNNSNHHQSGGTGSNLMDQIFPLTPSVSNTGSPGFSNPHAWDLGLGSAETGRSGSTSASRSRSTNHLDSKTNDIVNKINALVAYTKESGGLMGGGKKYKNATIKASTQGHRDMKGGLSAEQIALKAKNAQDLQDRRNAINASSAATLQGITNLKLDHGIIEARILTMTEEIQKLNGQIQTLTDAQGVGNGEIQQFKDDIVTLHESLEKLGTVMGAGLLKYTNQDDIANTVKERTAYIEDIKAKAVDMKKDNSDKAQEIIRLTNELFLAINTKGDELERMKKISEQNQLEINRLTAELATASQELTNEMTSNGVAMGEMADLYEKKLKEFREAAGIII
jgi:hypothetical protein